TRPRYREPVRAQAKLRHQVSILLDPVVVVGCHLAAVALIGLARRGREIVPDAGAPAILVNRTLDLIRGCGCAPQEMRRESSCQVGFTCGLGTSIEGNAHLFSCSLLRDTA